MNEKNLININYEMDSSKETQKRLKIAKKIAFPLKEIVKGILLGGSMGYGQNYSVTDKSDIDIVAVVGINNVDRLKTYEFFKGGIPKEVLQIFKKRKIDMFWITKNINGVEVNAFIYEPQSYIDFCLLNKDLKIYIGEKPSETQEAFGFDGIPIIFERNVKSFKKGFIYEKPCLIKGKYWGGVPRGDFYYNSEILFQKNNFFNNLEKKLWETIIMQLIKEEGENPDLNKTNVVNTSWVYRNAKYKLPLKTIGKIKNRTKEELEKYKL